MNEVTAATTIQHIRRKHIEGVLKHSHESAEYLETLPFMSKRALRFYKDVNPKPSITTDKGAFLYEGAHAKYLYLLLNTLHSKPPPRNTVLMTFWRGMRLPAEVWSNVKPGQEIVQPTPTSTSMYVDVSRDNFCSKADEGLACVILRIHTYPGMRMLTLEPPDSVAQIVYLYENQFGRKFDAEEFEVILPPVRLVVNSVSKELPMPKRRWKYYDNGSDMTGRVSTYKIVECYCKSESIQTLWGMNFINAGLRKLFENFRDRSSRRQKNESDGENYSYGPDVKGSELIVTSTHGTDPIFKSILDTKWKKAPGTGKYEVMSFYSNVDMPPQVESRLRKRKRLESIIPAVR
jgi:hypothetical protein